jgi:hypothetical protein
MVASGVLLEELEELDCALAPTPRKLRRRKDARHREKDTGYRRDNDFAEKDTI